MIKPWKLIALIPAMVTFGILIVVPDSLNVLSLEFFSLSLVLPLIVFMNMGSTHFKPWKACFYLFLGILSPICFYTAMFLLGRPRQIFTMITVTITSLLGILFFGVVILQLFITLLKNYRKR